MDLVIPAPPAPTLAVQGTEARFPVRRALCVGRNYRAHAYEMGGDPDREPPFFFAKPGDAVFDGDGATIPYPPRTEDLHHEVELVVAIGRALVDGTVEDALDAVYGYAVGIDLTRRDLQQQAKDTRRPWAMAKGFDHSGPVSPIAPGSTPPSGRIWLSVGGEVRQDATLDQLIWSVAELLAEASRTVALAPGDVIFTGTPAGVGPLVPGDVVEAGVEGVGTMRCRIGERG